MSDLVVEALGVAVQAHAGQVDKGGADYIRHVLAVGIGGYRRAGVDGLIVGLLHDVVEDSPKNGVPVTLADLAEVFPAHIVEAVDAISHRPHEPYVDYLVRVSANRLAAAVKRADVAHNALEERLVSITDPVVSARLERKRVLAVAALGHLD